MKIREICQSFDIDLSKMLHGFAKVVLGISRPLPKKTKRKVVDASAFD